MSIPIKLDPGLVSSTFKDPFQINPETLPLSHLIGRINHERPEHFLNLSQESLENEVVNEAVNARLEAGKPKVKKNPFIFEESAGSTETKDEPEEDKLETTSESDSISSLTAQLEVEKEKLARFHQNKAQVVRLIQVSLNEASLALDFVSLLATSLRPNAGKASMSPLLKQHVPIASLNLDRILQDDSTNGKIQNPITNLKLLVAWKIESLENSIQLLNKRKDTLAVETVKNKVYYESLHKLSTTNSAANDYQEILFKRTEKDIAIKYGFQDSGSSYNLDKGVAILAKTKTGELEFKPLSKPKAENKRIKVKLFVKRNSEDNEFVFCSSSGPDNVLKTDGGVREMIENARHRVFDEELFYQLVREAKDLLDHGVKIVSSEKITVELEDELLEISLEKPETVPKDSGSNNKKPTYIVHLLRLLLCHHHRKMLYDKDPIEPIPLLLRPIIGNHGHERFVKTMVSEIVDLYENELQWPISMQVGSKLTKTAANKDDKNHVFITIKKVIKPHSKQEIFHSAVVPPETRIEIEKLGVLTVETPTFCGTRVTLQTPTQRVTFSDCGEARTCLRWTASRDTASTVPQRF